MRGNKEFMNGEKEGHHQRTETSRTRIIAFEFEGSKYNCYVDQDCKDEKVKRTRKMGPTKDELHEVLHDVVGDSDENGLALYGGTEDENAEEKNIQARSILRKKKEKVNHKYTQSHKGKQKLTSGFFYEALDKDESPSSWYNPHGRVAHTGFEHDLEFEALAQRRIINAKVHEYYDSASEELEYETEFEDIESSPTHERENELDENNVYDKDLGVSSLPNEEIEGQEHKRGPRKGKAIDFGEQYPPKKRFLNRWRGNCY